MRDRVIVQNNPINRKDPRGLSDKCPCGNKWVGIAAVRTFNFKCRCKWLCAPPDGVWWTGNKASLPSTDGIVINSGPEPESGDHCLCPDPDGYGQTLPLGLEEHR